MSGKSHAFCRGFVRSAARTVRAGGPAPI